MKNKQIASTNEWRGFLTKIFDDNGFIESSSTFNGETESVVYKTTDQDSKLEIRVGYLVKNLLIYLIVFDPRIPGYNKHMEDDYFQRHDFHDIKTYGGPGLDFSSRNQQEIKDILKFGLEGQEIQFLKNDQILKSMVYLVNEEMYNHYTFIKRGFWESIFKGSIQNMIGVKEQVLNLNDIFSGLKNVV